MILGEVEARASEDAQRREHEQRVMAEREVRWQAAMEDARKRAVQDQLAEVLREEAGRWQEATVLGAYCDAPERCLAQPGDADESTLGSAGRRLECARGFVRVIDPLKRLYGDADSKGALVGRAQGTPEKLESLWTGISGRTVTCTAGGSRSRPCVSDDASCGVRRDP